MKSRDSENSKLIEKEKHKINNSKLEQLISILLNVKKELLIWVNLLRQKNSTSEEQLMLLMPLRLNLLDSRTTVKDFKVITLVNKDNTTDRLKKRLLFLEKEICYFKRTEN